MRGNTLVSRIQVGFLFQLACYLGAAGLLLCAFIAFSRINASPAQFLIGVLAAIGASVGMVALGLMMECLRRQG